MEDVGIGVKHKTKEMLSKLNKSLIIMTQAFPYSELIRIPGIIHNGFVRCFWRIKLSTPEPLEEISNLIVEMYIGDNNTIGEGLELPPPPISANDILRKKIATFRIPHKTCKIDIGNDISSPFIIVRPDYSDPNNPKNNRVYLNSTGIGSVVYMTVDYYDIEG